MRFHGTVQYNIELIDKRLIHLRAMGEQPDAEAEAERQRELAYLIDLRQRKFPGSPQSSEQNPEHEADEDQAAEA